MSLSDYIATLQKTKTYQAALISLQEYSFKSRMFGLARVLPNIPHADGDRHVVVLEIRGNQPNILTILTEIQHTIQATTKDVDKLLFIFVEMRPQTLVIEKSTEGYRLSDGLLIDAKFSITYKIEHAESFWRGSRDQLAELETTITNAAKDFFLNIPSNYIISRHAEVKRSLEHVIRDTEIKSVKRGLEQCIYDTCVVAGIKLLKVNADIYIGDSLHEYLMRIHDRLYGQGGMAERSKIDQIIDSDTTFAPYKLRDIIMALDVGLLVNFYSMNWNDAMRKVTERLAEEKQKYVKSIEGNEIEKMRNLRVLADDWGLDHMDKEVLKDKLVDKMLSLIDVSSNAHTLSDSEYVSIITTPSSGRLLESNTVKPGLLEPEKDDEMKTADSAANDHA